MSLPDSFELTLAELTQLANVTEDDIRMLHSIDLTEGFAARPLTMGRQVRPEEFSEKLWGGVLVHYMLVSAVTRQRVGYCAVVDPEFRNRTARLRLFRIPGVDSKEYGDAVQIFISHVFRVWGFRYLVLESVIGPDTPALQPIRSHLDHVGSLTDHVFIWGAYRTASLYCIHNSTAFAGP